MVPEDRVIIPKITLLEIRAKGSRISVFSCKANNPSMFRVYVQGLDLMHMLCLISGATVNNLK